MGERPTFLSLFSGIGGFDLGLERAGWRCVGQVEIDKFCNRVLDKRFPGVPRRGDIRGLDGEQEAPRPDLLVGGFPCQDISIAGKRAGLGGERSSLFWEFHRIASELRPRWLLVENVAGLLSSGRDDRGRPDKGRDLAIILWALSELGYGLAWRVLDSRFFGVPQRRRRLFLVGRLGAECPAEVLFEPEGGGGDSAARGAAGQEVAGTPGGGAPSARGRRDDLDTSGAFVETGHALRKSRRGTTDPDRDDFVIGPLGGGDYGAGRDRSNNYPNLAHALPAEGFDASEDGTGRGTPIIAAPLTHGSFDKSQGSRRPPCVVPERVVVFSIMPENSGKDYKAREVPVTQPLMTGSGAYGNQGGDLVVAFPTLRGFGHGWQGQHNDDAARASMVRRLTPTECERLQGFPDGWTCLCGCEPYSTEACRCPDGPRYAALGNAVTVNVAEWIGRRILAAHEAEA